MKKEEVTVGDRKIIVKTPVFKDIRLARVQSIAELGQPDSMTERFNLLKQVSEDSEGNKITDDVFNEFERSDLDKLLAALTVVERPDEDTLSFLRSMAAKVGLKTSEKPSSKEEKS